MQRRACIEAEVDPTMSVPAGREPRRKGIGAVDSPVPSFLDSAFGIFRIAQPSFICPVQSVQLPFDLATIRRVVLASNRDTSR
ncbi:unnamed protein product [Protopolystoma xenopodis]|uniref:Uncharacterized protein n=1 Tax=Protopolystoma xenopodis TaxID=117903 RepID=A0A448WR56_9PLAT|nr:unnamed protein product [Protopolystoma xenopodis]